MQHSGPVVFWTFAAEALFVGARSDDPICRAFQLPVRPPQRSAVQAGVRLVLGEGVLPSGQYLDGVRAVAATHRWAVPRVPALASAAAVGTSRPPIKLEDVAALLGCFEDYLALRRAHHAGRPGIDTAPKAWRLREGHAETATWATPAGRDATTWGLGTRALAPKRGRPDGRHEASPEPGDPLVRRLFQDSPTPGPEHGVCGAMPPREVRAERATSDLELAEGGRRADANDGSKLEEASKTGAASRQKGPGAAKRAAKQAHVRRRAEKSLAMPTAESPKVAMGLVGKLAARSKGERPIAAVATAVSRGAVAKRPALGGRVAPTRRSSAASGGLGQAPKRPRRGPDGHLAGAALAEESGEDRCAVCGQAVSVGTTSCVACTRRLASERGLTFCSGQRVWCFGFGPAWPGRIVAIAFSGERDRRPYCVRFYGEGSAAWVGQGKLRPWTEREPAMERVASRWHRRLGKAIDEAKAEPSPSKAAARKTAQARPPPPH